MQKNYNFSATVDRWIADSQKRCDAVMRQSIIEVIETAQRPTAKGGRMRVDTGFLRASGQVSFNGMPSGPGVGEKDAVYTSDDKAVSAAIAGMEAGATVYFGWTASYAKYREAYDGFLIGAIQNWSEIVNKYARRLQIRQAFKSAGE